MNRSKSIFNQAGVLGCGLAILAVLTVRSAEPVAGNRPR